MSLMYAYVVSGLDLLVMGGANRYGEGLVNCIYTSCVLCTKSCRPIRLQIANHTYEYNSISHAKWFLLLASTVGKQQAH